MNAALRFKHANVPRQNGELARLKVLQGPDYGAVFIIQSGRSTLGRGEENDIMVSDLKASRRHAEFVQAPTGWAVKDLGSANGLLHNGKTTRGASLKTGDTVTFGETTLEFLTPDAGTMMLVAPPRDAAHLQAERKALEEQKKRVRSFGGVDPGVKKSPTPDRRVLIYGAVAIGVALLFMSDPQPTKRVSSKKGALPADLSKYLPGATADPSTAKTAEQFFRAGYREYMAHNYLRAKSQFETVLQMSPGHSLATLYLENCQNGIIKEVKFHNDEGKKAMEAGKLKEARGHFEATLRMLHFDQVNPAYAEAKDQLTKVLLEIKGEGPN